jgi:hypothetical protein
LDGRLAVDEFLATAKLWIVAVIATAAGACLMHAYDLATMGH